MPASLNIQASAEDLRTASQWLERECARLDVPADQCMRLDLCLNEVVANVMAHGGGDATQAPVSLTMSAANPQQAELHIADSGKAFNPLTADIQQPANNLADAAIGGLGLTMITHYADDLQYEYRDGRNHLHVTVRWGRQAL